jgi:hypothetical protein
VVARERDSRAGGLPGACRLAGYIQGGDALLALEGSAVLQAGTSMRISACLFCMSWGTQVFFCHLATHARRCQAGRQLPAPPPLQPCGMLPGRARRTPQGVQWQVSQWLVKQPGGCYIPVLLCIGNLVPSLMLGSCVGSALPLCMPVAAAGVHDSAYAGANGTA